MPQSRKSLLFWLFSVPLVLLNPACLASRAPDAHDATSAEAVGVKTALLSQEAQGRLAELEDGLRYAHDEGDAQAEASILDSIGLLNYGNQRFDEALEAFSRSLALYRGLKAESFEATELCEQGAAYTALGMQQKALDSYKEALPMWRRVDRQREAATLGKIAEVFCMLHDSVEALHFNQAALDSYVQVGDAGGQATVLNNIGLAYFSSGNNRKAMSYFESARNAYLIAANPAGEATALNNLAVAYAASGDNNDALVSFDEALELQRKGSDRSAEAVTLNSIGIVYSRMGQSSMARKLYGEAASIYHTLGDQQVKTRDLNSLSLPVSEAKREGRKKKADTFEGLDTCAAQLPIIQ